MRRSLLSVCIGPAIGCGDPRRSGSYQLTNPTPPPAFTVIPAIVKDSGEALFGEEFDKKFTKRTVLTERFSFYPNLASTGDYRFQLDSNIATQLNNWLSWHVTLSDR